MPAEGPLMATMPGNTQSSEEAMITRMACQISSPSTTVSVAPMVKFSTLTFGAAQTAKRSRARPWRSDGATSSMPRVSGWVATSVNSWGATAGSLDTGEDPLGGVPSIIAGGM